MKIAAVIIALACYYIGGYLFYRMGFNRGYSKGVEDERRQP